jgi:hypothetical protein
MSENSTKDKEPKTSRDAREWRLEVTEDQYRSSREKGIEDESLLKPGTHTFRRRDPSRIIHTEQRTVILHLDEKTFAHFERRANAESKNVEAEISDELRAFAEKESA